MQGLEEADERFLKAAISRGDAVLVLGAGASATSTNRNGDPVAQSGKLAELVTEAAGQQYSGETLWEVLTAIQGEFLSKSQINHIYTEQYCGITPSEELSSLFDYTWKRTYTWNIDDSVENIRGRSAQRRKLFNGMIDKAKEFEEKTYSTS